MSGVRGTWAGAGCRPWPDQVTAATASAQAHEAAAIRKRTMVIRVGYYTALRTQTTPAQTTPNAVGLSI